MSGRVLELGAGTGTFTKVLAMKATSVDALEPSASSFRTLSEMMISNVTPLMGSLDTLSGQGTGLYDNAVLVNVLEHIEDDAKCLRELARLIRPGGGLAVWVPAHEFLYSEFDFKLGHYRRYSRLELEDLARDAGFKVDKTEYRNAAGAFAWLIVAKMAGREPTSRRLSGFWDRLVVRGVAALERRVAFPFGQSVLLLASLPE